jgi:hypothetical protein
MDTPRFDGLSRAIGRTTSRRQALAVLVGTAVGTVLPGLVRRPSPVWAAPDARPTGSNAAISCNNLNIVAADNCTDLSLYLYQCGVVCPGETTGHPTWSGCTTFDCQPVPTYGPIYADEPIFDRYCFSRHVTVTWQVNMNDSATLTVIPPVACCQSQCNDEIARWEGEVRAHEDARRNRNWEIVAQADADWADRIITGCGPDPSTARNALRLNGLTAISQTADWIQQSVHDFYPPDASPVDCLKCTPGTSQNWCENGTCRTCNGNVCPTATGFGGCCPPSDPYCCEESCCYPPYSICCGGGSSACCPPSHPYCVWDPYYGVICGRNPAGARAADVRVGAGDRTGEAGPRFVRALVAPKHK